MPKMKLLRQWVLSLISCMLSAQGDMAREDTERLNLEIRAPDGTFHTLSLSCEESPTNATDTVCAQAQLVDGQCRVVRYYVRNKIEAHCTLSDGDPRRAAPITTRLDPLSNPSLQQPLDAAFRPFRMGPSDSVFSPPLDVPSVWYDGAKTEELISSLAANVTAPWVSRGVTRESLDAVIDAEPECVALIWLLAEDRLLVRSPTHTMYRRYKAFLFQRRHDAIRLVEPLRAAGALKSVSAFEMAFCPRDCVVGDLQYEYSGMPSTLVASHFPRPTEELPAFGLVACLGSSNIPLPILSRRLADTTDLEWHEVVAMLKANALAHPFEHRRSAAVFRGEIYGRSCWDGSEGGRVEQRDTIKCGRPRLLWLSEQLGEAVSVDGINHMPLLKQEQFKFQLVVEGHCGWADRLQYLMHMGSVILLQETMCRQWLSLPMRPWVHHIPLSYHLDTLPSILTWARDPRNHHSLQQIIANCNALAEALLTTIGMHDFAAAVIARYAEAMRYDPTGRYEGWREMRDVWDAQEYLREFRGLETSQEGG